VSGSNNHAKPVSWVAPGSSNPTWFQIQELGFGNHARPKRLEFGVKLRRLGLTTPHDIYNKTI